MFRLCWLLILSLGRKLDREKEKIQLELEATLVKEARLRKVLRQLDNREKEMFDREIQSIEEQERLEVAAIPEGSVPIQGVPQSPSLTFPDWNQLVAWDFPGGSSQTLLPSSGNVSNVP